MALRRLTRRSLAVTMLLLLVATLQFAFARRTKVVPHRPLAEFPSRLGSWTQAAEMQIDADSAAVLKADDYVLRRMRNEKGDSVELFVAYYENQRAGESMHSPKNCMPGSGWDPVSISTVTLPDHARVNHYVVEKNGQRTIMLYWYQERGRTIANEYQGKFQLIASTILSGRRDGAIVRVSKAAGPRTSGADDLAKLQDFADEVRHQLPNFIPN